MGSRPLLAWASRLAQAAVTLFFVSACVFLATQVLPGNAAAVLLGTNASPERVRELSAQLGLSDPLQAQYWRWLDGIFHGSFGISLANNQPVAAVLGPRLVNSAFLAAVAFAIVVPLSLLIGVAAAQFKDTWADKLFLGSSMVANALPDFIIGTLLVFLFGTTLLHLFPPVAIIPIGNYPWQYPAKLVLPVATLVIGGTMYLSRLIRASVIDVLSSEYAEMAILKGLPARRLLFVHALPNALAPAVPAASLVAAFTVGGVVITEYLFNYPGIGVLLVQSVAARDLPAIQAVVLVIAVTYFILNFIADLVKVGKA